VGSSYAAGSLGGTRLSDVGPGETGHELHAKMEEAIEHAIAIINGAAKFAEEAYLEQVPITQNNVTISPVCHLGDPGSNLDQANFLQ
jgi:hypothetical protein